MRKVNKYSNRNRRGEYAPQRCIQIWAYNDAPTEFQTYDDDSDWVAFVPNGVEQPSWMQEGTTFGCCSVFETKVKGGTIYTGCHS